MADDSPGTARPESPPDPSRFDDGERRRVRDLLLAAAAEDPGITGAAVIGSDARDAADAWSDVDLAFAVRGEPDPVRRRWTARMEREFAAVHHWDLPSGSSVYRVFLLPGWLEVDLAFTPEEDFGPRGPAWRIVFGPDRPAVPGKPAGPGHLAGLAWHHARHARVCLERRQWWQAEHWISALRDQVVALACVRLGHPSAYAKGAHLLPPEVTRPLADALVRSLDETELRRALGAAAACLADELDRAAPGLGARLRPMLTGLAGRTAEIRPEDGRRAARAR